MDDINRFIACRNVLEESDVLVGDANTGYILLSYELTHKTKKLILYPPNNYAYIVVGWTAHDAMKIVKAVSNLDVYIEQPCVSYRECRSIRQHTNLPFVLDENISEFNHLVEVAKDNSADVVNIKISKFGGLTKAKLVIYF